MKRLLVIALSLALGLTATACTDSTSPGASLAGTYQLRTISGATPPVVIYQDASVTSEVVSGLIALDANGNYQSSTRYRDTYAGSQPQLVDENGTGYWTLSGNQIALTDVQYPNDPSYGTVSGSTITLVDRSSGVTFTLTYSR